MSVRVKNSIFLIALIFLCSCSDYDHTNPDAKPNRAAFGNFFNMDPAEQQVTGIYFFADEWGGDAAYWFAFSAPAEAIDQIILTLQLQEVSCRSDSYAPNVKPPLQWWNLAERKNSKYYEFRNQNERVDYYLWYNPATTKCQIAIVYF